MPFKKIFLVVVFTLFIALVSYEFMNIVQQSAALDVTSVRYVRSLEQKDTKADKKPFDISKILESNNASK